MTQIENDDWPTYVVYVTDVGEHPSKVFNLFRQVLQITPAEAKALLNSRRTEVARGPRMNVVPVAEQFRSAGAEVDVVVASDDEEDNAFGGWDSIENYQYILNDASGRYVLLQSRKGSNALKLCLVYDKQTKSALIVEDNAVALQLVTMLAAKGVPILDEIPKS